MGNNQPLIATATPGYTSYNPYHQHQQQSYQLIQPQQQQHYSHYRQGQATYIVPAAATNGYQYNALHHAQTYNRQYTSPLNGNGNNSPSNVSANNTAAIPNSVVVNYSQKTGGLVQLSATPQSTTSATTTTTTTTTTTAAAAAVAAAAANTNLV
jgi:hypothetical protein